MFIGWKKVRHSHAHQDETGKFSLHEGQKSWSLHRQDCGRITCHEDHFGIFANEAVRKDEMLMKIPADITLSVDDKFLTERRPYRETVCVLMPAHDIG